MSEWQPIETAPKDGTCIIVWGYWAGEISGPMSEPSLHFAEWDTYLSDYPGFDWRCCEGDYYASWVKPTHWMPLPEPPQDVEPRR